MQRVALSGELHEVILLSGGQGWGEGREEALKCTKFILVYKTFSFL